MKGKRGGTLDHAMHALTDIEAGRLPSDEGTAALMEIVHALFRGDMDALRRLQHTGRKFADADAENRAAYRAMGVEVALRRGEHYDQAIAATADQHHCDERTIERTREDEATRRKAARYADRAALVESVVKPALAQGQEPRAEPPSPLAVQPVTVPDAVPPGGASDAAHAPRRRRRTTR